MSESMVTTLWIALGGAIGSVARYWTGLMMAPYSATLPWGTILINVVGSFAITFFGTLTVVSGRFPKPDTARLFFMVGICGGFTTFSSFSLQTLELLRHHTPERALFNITASVLLCLVAASAGYKLAEQVNGGAPETAQIPVSDELS